ncbi:hypothetical protein E3O10_17755 [Cryobacterium luteum]|uniref:Uncharacterized protein n=1 Tax=Cryobacterium luteum TaxID=1424661 RepID=A0A5F0CZD6_9MICO|nr:hypothetical protein E3O10_17755 [Cryobacterium luteum]
MGTVSVSIPPPIADGRWQMADGRWQMADGRWQMADNGIMLWDLAHRTRVAAESTPARVEAPDSSSAVVKLRSKIPADHLVLYVRRTSQPAGQ